MFGIIRAIMPAGLIPECLCAFLIEVLQPVESTAKSSKEENLCSADSSLIISSILMRYS